MLSCEPGKLSEADINHRESFKRFVLCEAEEWHRTHLGRLYDLWECWNKEHFDERMFTPYLLLSVPGSTRALGDCSRISCFGGRSQVRIRPSLLTGLHRSVISGDQYAEGRFLFVADVLLHESIHQWQQEVTGQIESSYKGHGPAFRDKCNEIGAKLKMSTVRIAKARGKDKDLPSCAQWPHCVRPPEYYLGAVVERGKTYSGIESKTEDRGAGLEARAGRYTLYTTGYQEWNPQQRMARLLECLKSSRIEVLADIRHSACSSSLDPLNTYGPRAWHVQAGDQSIDHLLSLNGVKYVWLVELGNPQKNDPEMVILRRQIESTDLMWPVNRGLGLLRELVSSGAKVCLLCACADYEHCHRKLIAESLLERFFGDELEIRSLYQQ